MQIMDWSNYPVCFELLNLPYPNLHVYLLGYTKPGLYDAESLGPADWRQHRGWQVWIRFPSRSLMRWELFDVSLRHSEMLWDVWLTRINIFTFHQSDKYFAGNSTSYILKDDSEDCINLYPLNSSGHVDYDPRNYQKLIISEPSQMSHEENSLIAYELGTYTSC